MVAWYGKTRAEAQARVIKHTQSSRHSNVSTEQVLHLRFRALPLPAGRAVASEEAHDARIHSAVKREDSYSLLASPQRR